MKTSLANDFATVRLETKEGPFCCRNISSEEFVFCLSCGTNFKKSPPVKITVITVWNVFQNNKPVTRKNCNYFLRDGIQQPSVNPLVPSTCSEAEHTQLQGRIARTIRKRMKRASRNCALQSRDGDDSHRSREAGEWWSTQRSGQEGRPLRWWLGWRNLAVRQWHQREGDEHENTTLHPFSRCKCAINGCKERIDDHNIQSDYKCTIGLKARIQ